MTHLYLVEYQEETYHMQDHGYFLLGWTVAFAFLFDFWAAVALELMKL